MKRQNRSVGANRTYDTIVMSFGSTVRAWCVETVHIIETEYQLPLHTPGSAYARGVKTYGE